MSGNILKSGGDYLGGLICTDRMDASKDNAISFFLLYILVLSWLINDIKLGQL